VRDDDLQELLTIFKSESEEHLQKLNEGILTLEKEPDKKDVLEEIFREAHSLKGAARMIGFEEIEKIAHAIEDVFNDARKGRLLLTGAVSDYVLEGLDLVNRIVVYKLRGKGAGEVSLGDYLDRHASVVAAAGRKGPRQPPAPETGAPSAPSAPPSAGVPPAARGADKVSRRGTAEKGFDKPRRKGVERPSAEPPPVVEPSAAERPPEAGDGGISISIGVKDDVSRVIRQAEDKSRARRRQNEPVEAAPQYEETIRVSVDKLDELMAQVGEILVTKIRSDVRLQEVREFLNRFTVFQRAWHRHMRSMVISPMVREDRVRLMSEFVATHSRVIDDLSDSILHLSDGMAEDNLRLELISGNIQESVNRIRMLPMSALFNYFPRLIRDIAREEAKEVELVVRGGETRLDKRILEELKDPLTHLVRNSIDHGIEKGDERQAAGKPRVGRLTLSAYQKGNSVLVELEDDGQGIDPVKIREVALRRGFISAEALDELTPSQIIQVIFQPGFTTKSIITDVSGRGVGLDVVLTNIERLKGKLSTTSTPGRGTRFSIKLPLTLATTQALLIRSAGQRFALPLTAVEFTGEIDLDDISTVEGKETVLVNGALLSLIRMAEVLELPSSPEESGRGRIPLVVLSSTDERIAFTVDEFIGEREVVVKGLGSHLARVPNVAGATLLADGTPVMILNVFDLIKNARRARGQWVVERVKAREKAAVRSTILVVDDSITTRTLEKNILESSGYTVVTAVDGIEALEKARARKPDLVVTDVQMPRMDGFALTAALKKDKNLNAVPVILVTSLESEEDKKMGIDAGADAYITKGAFDQGNLLNTIRQLL
jgi:two-component system chemotaxis sensor kinase CheA